MMATAYTSSASLPASANTNNQWSPSTTHDDQNPDFDPSDGAFDDDPSAYETSPTTANGHADHQTNDSTRNGHLTPPTPFPPRRSSLLPDPTRAPLPIALRASFLSLTLGICTPLTLHLLRAANPLWRLPFFACTLSTFHLLEFYTTAIYNPLGATVSAFLLDNGRAYNIAHGAAFVECLLHFAFLPHWSPLFALTVHPLYINLGLLLMMAGQTVRSAAMAHAGSNFNHIVQAQKQEGHKLVTDGIYAWLRHPSYFGFFWWSLGTQVVLGNVVCLVGFAVVLGRFFRRRVRREEELLVGFFGGGYLRYRGRTGVGIPFVG